MSTRRRLDAELVRRGLARSREHAAELVTAGRVVVAGQSAGKTATQVALRFLLQEGAIVIPRTTRSERLAENFDVFDFALSAAEMGEIHKLAR